MDVVVIILILHIEKQNTKKRHSDHISSFFFCNRTVNNVQGIHVLRLKKKILFSFQFFSPKGKNVITYRYLLQLHSCILSWFCIGMFHSIMETDLEMSDLVLKLVWVIHLFLLPLERNNSHFPPAWILFWITLHSSFSFLFLTTYYRRDLGPLFKTFSKFIHVIWGCVWLWRGRGSLGRWLSCYFSCLLIHIFAPLRVRRHSSKG